MNAMPFKNYAREGILEGLSTGGNISSAILTSCIPLAKGGANTNASPIPPTLRLL